MFDIDYLLIFPTSKGGGELGEMNDIGTFPYLPTLMAKKKRYSSGATARRTRAHERKREMCARGKVFCQIR